MHVGPILVDPCVYLISSADGPVAGDEDIDVARDALEQPQRGEDPSSLPALRGVIFARYSRTEAGSSCEMRVRRSSRTSW